MSLAGALMRLVGVDRNRPSDPFEAERQRVVDARAELERVRESQNAKIAEARTAFDRVGTEDAADDLARIERRAQIMVDAAQRKLAAATEALATAEADAKTARIAELEQIVADTTPRVTALKTEALAHMRALLAVIEQRKELLAASIEANEEAGRLRGDAPDLIFARRRGIDASASVLRNLIADEIGFADREELRQLLDGTQSIFGAGAA
ncbi:MAG TPA: hypothetical protein VHE30_25960 [Polyangiaceae bacterium]|nr:hypothetical protein [Polyangiaceae bacterium]